MAKWQIFYKTVNKFGGLNDETVIGRGSEQNINYLPKPY